MPDDTNVARIALAPVTPVIPPRFTPAVLSVTGAAVAAPSIPQALGGVPLINSLATVRPEQVKLFNPALAAAIAQLRSAEEGVPRKEITVPISIAADVSDEALFEDPVDPAKTYYLPRYHVAESNQQLQISLAPSGAGCVLTIIFEKSPAPSLRESARSAAEMAHSIAVILRHRLRADAENPGYKEIELPFTPGPTGGVAVLKVDTGDQRDLLYQALTNPAYGTSLAVRRLFTLAIPLPVLAANSIILSRTIDVYPNQTLALDTGVVSTDGDVQWVVQSGARRLAIQGAAKIANLGVVGYDGITPQQLRALNYVATPLDATSNDPAAVLIATPNWMAVYVKHYIGVWFDAGRRQWAIFNQDITAMPEGALFNVAWPNADCFTHRASGPNIVSHITYLDSPLTNNDPGATVLATPSWNGVYITHAIGVWYDAGRAKWSVFHQDMTPMPEGATFAIMVRKAPPVLTVPPPVVTRGASAAMEPLAPADASARPGDVLIFRSRTSFRHTTDSANTAGHCTFLESALTNNNPDVIPVITANWTGVYDPHPLGVWYEGGRKKWSIFFQDITPIPAGSTFNVDVRRPGKTAFVHRATKENTVGHCTYFDLPGDVVKGTVLAVSTARGNYAVAQVMALGDTLTLQWTTYRGIEASLFRPTTRSLDSPPDRDPFVFPPDLYPYIFKGLTANPDNDLKTILRTVFWGTEPHHYYQDPVDRWIFYYLPDSFKLRRRPDQPRYPSMAVQIVSADGSKETTKVTVDFWVFPFVDARRIAAAKQNVQDPQHSLFPYVNIPLPQGGIDLKPWLPEKATLFIMLPRSDGSTAPQEVRGIGNLRDGFNYSVTLPLTDFLPVYDAIFTTGAVLFQGDMKVALTDDSSAVSQTETIKFTAQMNDMVGDPFAYTQEPDPDGGGFRVTLRNVIESPIEIDGLTARLRRGAAEVEGRIEELTLPVAAMAPSQDLKFLVRPTLPLTGAEPLEVFFDLNQVKVLSDARKIFDVILKGNMRPEYDRTVEVQIPAAVFQRRDSDNDKISQIMVYFKRGSSVRQGNGPFKQGNGVQLSADNLVGEVKVQYPIKDLIRTTVPDEGVPDEGEYTYRLKLIYESGKQRDSRSEDGQEIWNAPQTANPLVPEVI